MSAHDPNVLTASMIAALRLLSTGDTLSSSANRVASHVPYATARALVRRGLARRDAPRKLVITDAGRVALAAAGGGT